MIESAINLGNLRYLGKCNKNKIWPQSGEEDCLAPQHISEPSNRENIREFIPICDF